MIFALAGNQNCGKTTLFNQLTGSNQHVGNFPGVTVDQKSGPVRGQKDCTVVDLPGIYSLRPYTAEEIVTRDFILKNKPDGIINIVDATNLERNLYLTLQLLTLRVPTVLALNMMDELTGNGGSIDTDRLSQQLGVPVIPICAASGDGVEALIEAAVRTAQARQLPSVVDFCRRTCPGFYRNVHLMMNRPDLYLEAFAQAGAQTIQIHVEADCDLHTELRRIRAMGLKNAIVLNPETPVARLEPYLGEVDEILVMTVHPGFGGQKFIDDCLPKLTYLRARLPNVDLMVDGGVDAETAVRAARAGANQFVAGSYLFKQTDMKAAVENLRESLK